MAVGDAHVFSNTSTNTICSPKPPATFLTCFSRSERRKYAGKKFRLNRVSNSQPPAGHESNILTTERGGAADLAGNFATGQFLHVKGPLCLMI